MLPRPPTSTLFPYTTLFRSHRRGDPDRAVLWTHRQFHQWRAVRARDRCPLGHDLPEWRVGSAPSEPALRSRSEEHTSELQSRQYLVCRLLLEKKKNKINDTI